MALTLAACLIADPVTGSSLCFIFRPSQNISQTWSHNLGRLSEDAIIPRLVICRHEPNPENPVSPRLARGMRDSQMSAGIFPLRPPQWALVLKPAVVMATVALGAMKPGIVHTFAQDDRIPEEISETYHLPDTTSFEKVFTIIAVLGGIWAIYQILNTLSVRRLCRILSSGKTEKERIGAAGALGKSGGLRAINTLSIALKDDPEVDVRKAAVSALREIRDPRSITAFLEALEDPAANVREEAVMGLRAIGGPLAIKAVATALNDDWGGGVRQRATQALGEIALLEDTQVIEALEEATYDRNDFVSRAAEKALDKIRNRGGVEATPAVFIVRRLYGVPWKVLVGRRGMWGVRRAQIIGFFKWLRRAGNVPVDSAIIGTTGEQPVSLSEPNDGQEISIEELNRKALWSCVISPLSLIALVVTTTAVFGLFSPEWLIHTLSMIWIGAVGGGIITGIAGWIFISVYERAQRSAVQAKLPQTEEPAPSVAQAEPISRAISPLPSWKHRLKRILLWFSFWSVPFLALAAAAAFGQGDKTGLSGNGSSFMELLTANRGWVAGILVAALGFVGLFLVPLYFDPVIRVRRAIKKGELDKKGLPVCVLLNALKSRDWRVREAVVKVLGKPGYTEAIPVFSEALMGEQGHFERYMGVRDAMVYALGKIGGDEAVEVLLMVLKHDGKSWSERKIAASVLGKIGNQQAIPDLLEAMNSDEYPDVRAAAAVALGNLGYPVIPHLLQVLDGVTNPDDSMTIRELIAEMGMPAISGLFEVFVNNAYLRHIAAHELIRIGNQDVVEALAGALEHSNWRVASVAARALGAIGIPTAIPALKEALKNHPREEVLLAAAQALQEIWNRQGTKRDAHGGKLELTAA